MLTFFITCLSLFFLALGAALIGAALRLWFEGG